MIKNYESAKICKLLNYETRSMLVKASQVRTDKDPLARLKAVEEAMVLAKVYQPKWFV